MHDDTATPGYDHRKSPHYPWPAATVYGGQRTIADERRRSTAIHALTRGIKVVYAMRVPDGAIKIGCTSNLPNRLSGLHGEILAFRPGDFADEKELHLKLAAHRNRGREYYNPTPEVVAVVNDMRDHFGLPHLAA